MTINAVQTEQQRARFGDTIVVVAIILALWYLAGSWTNKKHITRWNVAGAKLLTYEEITSLAEVSNTDSVRRSSVSLFAVESVVSRHNFIRNSQVYFSGTNGVTIEIEERNPIAALVDNDGSLKYIDSSGKRLPYRLFSTVSNVPLLYGIVENGNTDSGFLAEAIELTAQLQRRSGYDILPRLGSMTRLNDKRCWELHFDDDDVLVLVENTPDLPRKLHVALHEVSRKPGLIIDLRWKDKIVCRPTD